MKFETEYKNLNFSIHIEKVPVIDVSLLLGDKFNRVANRVLIELKKGNLAPYHLIISSFNLLDVENERTHYWSNIILTSNSDELLEELGLYLEDEEILDSIVANWELVGDETGPGWK